MSVRLIISGEIDSGKTSLCEWVVRELKQADWDVAGILTRGVFIDRMKIAFDAVNLRSGESRRLAELRRSSDTSMGPRTKRWAFRAETLDWANRVLQTAVPCQALIVDELGPLEFERKKGLQAGVEAIHSSQYNVALIVVRGSLLDEALKHWPDSHLVHVQSLDLIREQAGQILKTFGSQMHKKS